jgi:hypothetical protein
MRIISLGLLAFAMALSTGLIGWMAVPTLALMYAAKVQSDRAAIDAALAAAAAWLVLLLRMAAFPAFGTLLKQLGQLFPVPGVAVAGLTLALAALLAWSAARMTLGLIGMRRAPRG